MHQHFVIQAPVVVNSNTAQVLVVTEIPLSPPAFQVDAIHKVIEIDDSMSGQVVEITTDMWARTFRTRDMLICVKAALTSQELINGAYRLIRLVPFRLSSGA